MRSKVKNIILIILLLISLVSCTERIDIELDESTVRLVVEGTITTDTISHKVLLSKSSSYYFNQPPEMVSGATVIISDGNNSYNLAEVSPGVYQTAPSVYGVPGKTYTLGIKLGSQIGGYSDYLAASTLHEVARMDSVGLAFHPDWSTEGIWEVKCYVQDPSTTDFYRFLVLKNGTMLSDTLDNWFVTDDRFINGYYVNGATVSYLDQGSKEERLAKGDTIVVELDNIGEEYANFVWEAQSEIRGSNPLFSGPPANVKGNINNGAIGFFAAYGVTRSQTTVPGLR